MVSGGIYGQRRKPAIGRFGEITIEVVAPEQLCLLPRGKAHLLGRDRGFVFHRVGIRYLVFAAVTRAQARSISQACRRIAGDRAVCSI